MESKEERKGDGSLTTIFQLENVSATEDQLCVSTRKRQREHKGGGLALKGGRGYSTASLSDRHSGAGESRGSSPSRPLSVESSLSSSPPTQTRSNMCHIFGRQQGKVGQLSGTDLGYQVLSHEKSQNIRNILLISFKESSKKAQSYIFMRFYSCLVLNPRDCITFSIWW